MQSTHEEQEMKDIREGVGIDNDVGSIMNDNNAATTAYSRTHIIVNTLYLPDVGMITCIIQEIDYSEI